MVHRVEIKRSRHGLGRTDGGQLRHVDRPQLQCCMGFICEVAGLDPKDFEGVGHVAKVINKLGPRTPEIPEILRPLLERHPEAGCQESWLAKQLASANDCDFFASRAEQEAALQRIAAPHYEFVFVD